MIYVTHDQAEAMTMGDRICVMRDGRILQVDKPLGLYRRPQSLFVAGFIGTPPMNFFRGTLHREDGKIVFMEGDGRSEGWRLELSDGLNRRGAGHIGRPLVLGVRPESVRAFEAGEPEEGASWPARVEIFEPMGSEAYLYLNSGLTPFVARVASSAHFEFNQGVRVSVDFEAVHLFDGISESGFKRSLAMNG